MVGFFVVLIIFLSGTWSSNILLSWPRIHNPPTSAYRLLEGPTTPMLMYIFQSLELKLIILKRSYFSLVPKLGSIYHKHNFLKKEDC